MSDTSGFYKVDDNLLLLYAQNFVISSQFSLIREDKDSYVYPIEGWMWFDSDEAARTYFNIPAPEPQPDLDLRPFWARPMTP